MGKVLSPILAVAAVAVNFIPGVGQVASAALLKVGLTVGAKAALAITTSALALGSALSAPRPPGAGGSATLAEWDPRSVNVAVDTPRKLLLGAGLFAADLRYAEAYGTDQANVDYIFVLAAHRSHAVDEIWLGDKQAWTAGGGVTADFAGFLTVEIILEAGPSAFHTAGTSGKWGASQRLTGCTTAKLTVKRTANGNTQSPFPSGLSGQVSFIGRGMPVYDPALDSTVPGGSGPQRANDCTTWAWTVGGVERGRNPALQQLAYRLGWRIGGADAPVSVGQGIPAALLNRPEFAVAAALCDEAVSLAAGGSARRFEAGLWATDQDAPDGVVQALNMAMNGQVTTRGGRIGLRLAVNTLTSPVITLRTSDVMGPIDWTPNAPLDRRWTVVRGTYTVPSGETRYGAGAVPPVAVPRPSLVPRPLTLDLRTVQRVDQAQRIFKRTAQRSLVQGIFEAPFGIRARMLQVWDTIAFDFLPRGWVGKRFEVLATRMSPANGATILTLREIDASLDAWDDEDSAPVTPIAPVPFDRARAQSWLTAGIQPGATRNEDGGGNLIASPIDLLNVSSTESLIRRTVPGHAGATSPWMVVHDAMATGLGYFDKEAGFPVTPGERIWVRARYYQLGLPSGSTLRLKAEFVDAAGAYIAGADIFIGLRTVGTNFPNDTVTEVIDSFVVPANAAGCRLSSNPNNSLSGIGYSAVERPWAGRQQPGATVGAPAGTPVAGVAAETLVADAATAKADAAAALSTLSFIADDSYLSRDEKPEVRKQRDIIIAEYAELYPRASSYSTGDVPSQTAYATAYANLIAYLDVLDLGGATDTFIVRSVFNFRFVEYFAQRDAVLAEIAGIVSGQTRLLDAGTGRAVTRRMLPQIINSGVIQIVGNQILTATTDGSGVATIAIDAHPVLDDAGMLSFSSSSIGGLAASQDYYVYEINPNYIGGARSYSATTDRNVLATPGARFVGFIRTPAAGGSSSGSGAGAGFQTPGNPEWEP